MRLKSQGVKVPKLGSLEDYIWQQFTVQEAEKNLLGQKLLLFNTIAQSGGNKEFVSEVLSTWNRLVSLTYGMDVEDSNALTDDYMLKEYEKIKNLRPKFKVEKNGKITVSGLEVLNEKSKK